MTLEMAMQRPPTGPIHKPVPAFVNMTDPAGDGFTGISGVIRNVNRSGQSDKHTTMGTGRSLEKGSTSWVAFDWRWEELNLTGWNLVAQLQMVGSPIWAISVEPKTGRWFANLRDGTIGRKYDLGPVQLGKWAYFVVGCRLDDKPKGWSEVRMAWGDWPDETSADRHFIQTWQGRTGHHTYGLYADHQKPGSYTGFMAHFGRAASPERALELATHA